MKTLIIKDINYKKMLEFCYDFNMKFIDLKKNISKKNSSLTL